MKLPNMTVEQALFFDRTLLYQIGTKDGSQLKQGIIPAVTIGERNASQQFINDHCHNLVNCIGNENCGNLAARGRNANICTWHRCRVREYYIERNVADQGDHQAAIVHDDNVAHSCLTAYVARGCQPPL